MLSIILTIHVLICLAIIALVLLQQGKGADMGAAFGSGASQTVFGSQGSGSFLLKLTGILAALFFVTCIGLGYLNSSAVKHQKSLAQSISQYSQPVKTISIPAKAKTQPQQKVQHNAINKQVPAHKTGKEIHKEKPSH